jgi:glycosyltransferase involved in cell wall biosynthesis
MKASIITPSHDVKFLSELRDSILEQTYQDWEWVILLNNGAQFSDPDPRVKIYECPFVSNFVGALKKHACSLATGEIIIEADHDDILTPDCVEKVMKAFENENIGFVYSDNAKLAKDFIPYNPYYGWSYKTFNWKGRDLIAMNSLPLTPGRLGHIWYAPDHVRAWRKAIYDQIGGHNEELELCDDLELMHRFYFVTQFHYIPEILYVYRINGDNTWLKRNEAVQKETVSIYHKNIFKLAERFCEINGLMKIDLCAGFNKPIGYTGIDLMNTDIIWDLNNGIPLPDNSCGIVRAFDALEHIQNKQLMMKEIHRVLYPGGMLLSRTPSTDGRGAWQDPTHVSFWNENSFWYWIRPDLMAIIRNKDVRFFESWLTSLYPTDWHRQNSISYVEAYLEKM